MLDDIANTVLFAIGFFSFVKLVCKWIEVRWPEKPPKKEEPIEVEWEFVSDVLEQLPVRPQKFLPPRY
jgi:hypothetical protein